MQEINEVSKNFHFFSTKETVLNKIRSFLLFTFGVIDFLSLFAFSALATVNPSAATAIGKISSLLIIFLFVNSLVLPKTPRQVIFWLCFGAIAIVDYGLNQRSDFLSQLILIGLSLGSLNIDFNRILKTFMYASILSTLVIVCLSIIGILPIDGEQSSVLFSSYQNIVFCFGFIHPNTFGTILFSIAISFICLYSDTRPKWSWVVAMASILFDFLIGAQTAAVGVIIILIGLFCQGKKTSNIAFTLYHIAYIIPVLLFIFSIVIAQSQGSLLYNWFNQYIASRPSVWNYYLSNYQPKLIGNVVNIDLSVISNVYGNGVLDGSYIYYLLHFGYIGLIILIWAMISINKKGFTYKNSIYHWIFIAVCLTSFPESNFTIFFFNPFLYLIFLNQLSQEKITQYGGQKNTWKKRNTIKTFEFSKKSVK
ncbi:hypothetical protein R5R46_01360 [Oenococcus oeni]